MNILTRAACHISPGVSRFASTNVRTHCIFAVGIFTTNITRTLVYVYKKMCFVYKIRTSLFESCSWRLNTIECVTMTTLILNVNRTVNIKELSGPEKLLTFEKRAPGPSDWWKICANLGLFSRTTNTALNWAS